MRALRTRSGLAIAAAIVLSAVLATAAGAKLAASWQLVDDHQTACFSPDVTTSYYGIWTSGHWRRPIDVGAQALPAGSSFSSSNAPIPPGSSTGVYSLAYVRVQIPAATPAGTYTASLWASDGRHRETVPIALNVQSRCGY